MIVICTEDGSELPGHLTEFLHEETWMPFTDALKQGLLNGAYKQKARHE